MTQTRDEILKLALETYGPQAQQDMMIEEMSELTKAICKLRRAGHNSESSAVVASVLEEIADVQIMLDQMKILFGAPDAIDRQKIARLADRLDKSIGTPGGRHG